MSGFTTYKRLKQRQDLGHVLSERLKDQEIGQETHCLLSNGLNRYIKVFPVERHFMTRSLLCIGVISLLVVTRCTTYLININHEVKTMNLLTQNHMLKPNKELIRRQKQEFRVACYNLIKYSSSMTVWPQI